jgi:Zn-dependent protease
VNGTFVLSPAVGTPVPIPASAWQATLDLLHQRAAFHDSLIDAWRKAPGVQVTDAQASMMAWVAADEALTEGHDEADAEGLQRFADFCRFSGGFTVLDEAPVPAVAGGTVTTDGTVTPRLPVTTTEAPPVMPPAEPNWQRTLRRRLGPFGVLIIILAKWIFKLKALLYLLPKIKFLTTGSTALISIGVYALFWGWPFAALFVLLLFIHEMGHVIQLRREGIPASAPMFIPFMGAFVAMKGLPKDAYVEAKVGLAGPLLGGLGCAALALIGEHQHSNMLLAAAYFGFLINLFNLAPVTPLDGGRAAAAVHPYVWIAGIGGLAFLFFRFHSPFFLLILVLGGMDAMRRIRQMRDHKEASMAYYSVTPRQRIGLAVVYFALAAAMVAGMEWSIVPRPV